MPQNSAPTSQEPSQPSVISTNAKSTFLAHKELCRPFEASQISWRLGATNAKKNKEQNINNGCPSKGIALAYITARDVMMRLDEVVGPFNWETHMSEIAGTSAVSLTLTIDGQKITRTDTAGQTDVEGEKGAASTSLRRAAAQFGIGRYLYKLPNVWVDVGDYGRFEPPALPSWALPQNWDNVYTRIEAKFL